MEKNTLFAYIRFTGTEDDDFPLTQVTERLGIQPTRTWKIGEKINGYHARTFTSWHSPSLRHSVASLLPSMPRSGWICTSIHSANRNNK